MQMVYVSRRSSLIPAVTFSTSSVYSELHIDHTVQQACDRVVNMIKEQRKLPLLFIILP